jgi:hypothetical protein
MAKVNNSIRGALLQGRVCLKELKSLCAHERWKQRSKYSEAELAIWELSVSNLTKRGEDLQHSQLKFIIGNSSRKFSSKSSHATSSPASEERGGHGGDMEEQQEYVEEQMTSAHRLKLEEINKQERREDELLSRIDETVDKIGIQAESLGEESFVQSRELKDFGGQVVATTLRITTVNEELKYVVREVDSNGSFWLSMLCVVLLMGLCGLFYKIVQKDVK